MSVHARGIISERDYVSAQYLHLRPRRVFSIAGLILIFFALIVGVIARSFALLAILAFFAGYFALFVPWQARRNYREFKALSLPMELEARSDGLYARTQNGESLHPWDHFRKWRSNDKVLLLYPARNMFYIVPTHLFPSLEERDAFRNVIQKHVGSAA